MPELIDTKSIALEDALREAQANVWRHVEMLRTQAEQFRMAAAHLDAEANRLVSQANEHPYQHSD